MKMPRLQTPAPRALVGSAPARGAQSINRRGPIAVGTVNRNSSGLPPCPLTQAAIPARRRSSFRSRCLGIIAGLVSFALAAHGTVTEFNSAGIITIPSAGNAAPYPSTITVSGITGTVTAVRVKLNGFSHTYPDDVDVFLVAPGGQVCAILSDAGEDGALADVNLVFDDAAATVIPDDTAITSGTYRPANYETGEPLPFGGTGTIGTTLTALAAGGVNGDWTLFVSDDVGGDSGSITSWTVVIETGAPTPPEIVIEQPTGTLLSGVTSVVAWGNNAYGQTTIPAGLTGAQAVAAGYDHTVALNSDGTVTAWGRNDYGQTTAPGGLAGVQAIAAGAYHTVALKTDGTLVAWGHNDDGQTSVPAGLTGVQAIAAGDYHTLALRSDGTVVAWGSNNQGQRTVPAGLAGVQAIAGGGYHTAVVKTDGTVVAWGSNGQGQTTVPAGLTGVVAVAAGFYHTVALKNDGTVVAWGNSDNGQATVPGGLTGVQAIAAGDFHSVALKSDGTVVAWGYNGQGQTTVPAGLNRVQAIAGGVAHTVALVGISTVAYGNVNLGSSAAKTFTIKNTGSTPLSITGVSTTGGNNGDFIVNTTGMLSSVPGSSQTTFSVTFTPAVPGARTTTLRVLSNDADEGTSDITLTGTGVGVPEIAVEQSPGTPLAGSSIVAWGDNTYNQTTTQAGLTSVIAIGAGVVHTIALKNDGTVVCWGDNGTNQLNVPGGLAATAIAAGYSHNLAVRLNGTVAAWGGAGPHTTVPPALSGVRTVSAGISHSVALKYDGSVVPWGNNTFGQLNVPPFLTNAQAIAAGGYHTLALSNGIVAAWGDNSNGQTAVPLGLGSVQAIAAGYANSLALKFDGTVVAWGDNTYGQRNVPTGLIARAIFAGANHVLAIKLDGTVVAWGQATSGKTTVPGGLTGVAALAAGGEHSVALIGASNIGFGIQVVGTTSEAKTFTIKNSGSAPLAITGLTTTGGNSGDFIVNTTGMLTSVPAPGQTTFTVTFFPTAAFGLRATTLRVLSDDSDESTIDLALSGESITPAQAFQAAVAAAGLTGADAAADATPYGDGVPNLVKYAFKMNLAGADGHSMPLGGTSGLPTAVYVRTQQPALQVQYVRLKTPVPTAPALIYRLKKSVTLQGFDDLTPPVGGTYVEVIDHKWERVTVSVPVEPETTPRLFIRMQVEVPSND